MNITLLDTSIATDNLGDRIIMEAIEDVLKDIFPAGTFFRIPTHEYLSNAARSLTRSSELSFVCGTNLLSSRMLYRPQWKLRPWDVRHLNNAVLCGVGWRKYGANPDAYTQWLLSRVLHSGQLHSVRDDYTKTRLTGLGRAVCNTSCPTLWNLSPSHCAKIPTKKAKSCVTTLTYYIARPKSDKAVMECLLRNYANVYFWPQQEQDTAYLRGMALLGVKFLEPSIQAYNEFLANNDTDFVGFRLHGGIRALQKYKRALILPVDNRATEISRDTRLPIMDRADIDGIEKWIWSDAPTALQLPKMEIENWKAQFS